MNSSSSSSGAAALPTNELNASALPAALRNHFNSSVTTILQMLDQLVQSPDLPEEIRRNRLQQIKAASQHLLVQLNSPEHFQGKQKHPFWAHQGVPPAGLVTHSAQSAGEELSKGEILITDDNVQNRDLLTLLLAQQGYRVATAENGTQAFRSLLERKFDLLLLDIAMPEMDGFEVLRRLKADDRLRHLPVIMISGVDQTESVIRCIEMGAEDFMPKPFNPVLLRARIEASLEKKRLRDQEQAHLLRLQAEQQKSESLLLNILPQPIAERLKTGESTIVDAFPDVTVLFADLADFTQFTSLFRPSEVVEYLNEIFSEFDRLADQHQVEKIKTIGDAYMLVGGLPTHRPDHAEAVANLALAMRDVLDRVGRERSPSLQIRIGISSGPVIAGIIGTRKFTYDLWGDTVNIASRMEAYGQPGQIQVAPSTYERLKDSFEFRPRGLLEIKGKGAMPGYFLVGKKASA